MSCRPVDFSIGFSGADVSWILSVSLCFNVFLNCEYVGKFPFFKHPHEGFDDTMLGGCTTDCFLFEKFLGVFAV